MSRPGAIASGDRVRIIDEQSPYFGKCGVVKAIVERDVRVVRGRRRKAVTLQIELEGGEEIGISDYPRPLRHQIEKL